MTHIFILKKQKTEYKPGDPFDIICMTHVGWDHIWQRNHHTMTQLAKRHKVIYCIPESAHVALKHPKRFKPTKPEIMGDLIYFKIMRLSGEGRLNLIYCLNKFIVMTALKKLAQEFNFKPYILWFYFPYQENIAGSMDELLSVYDIQDNYSAFAWAPRNVMQNEQSLFKKVDIVFTGTDALREQKQSFHNFITFFPCGVEFDHFAKTDFSKTPDDIKDLKGPILGYFGLIDGRIDSELLDYMADTHKDWNIFMIGPVDANVFKPTKNTNIIYSGKRDYKLLPYYLQKFDVCLMPFAINEMTSKINPTKTLEYFASGKPVVSTAIPDMVKFYKDVLGISYSKEEFVKLCEEALKGSPIFNIPKGMELAKNKSWESIVGSMEDIIKNKLNEKYNK